MKKLLAFIRTNQHCELSVIELCRYLNIKVTKTTIKKDLIEHPNYPSLLSISDIIKNYGIDNMGVKIDTEAIKHIDLPIIVNIAGKNVNHDLFAVVNRIDADFVYLYNPETNKNERYDFIKFNSIYKGISLALQVKEQNGEKEYKRNRKEEIQKNVWYLAALIMLPLLVIIACIGSIRSAGENSIFPILYSLVVLFGCISSILLIWYEIDQYNPFLQQLCTAGKKVNCGAILSSKGAKIFGLTWTQIGASYYFGVLLLLLTGGILNYSNLRVLFWISVLALPYIIYSISYQKFVVKQWCVLCLTIQVILLLQFSIGFLGNFGLFAGTSIFFFESVIKGATCFAISFAFFLVLIPALKNSKDGLVNSLALQRIKHNPQAFEALLLKQKSVDPSSVSGLGLKVGNQNGKFRLLKVCNPYCQPCARAHPAMDALIELNENLGMQILFSVFPNTSDPSSKIARHLMSIAEEGNENLTKQALDDWYLPEKKDYEIFATKYPVKTDIDLRLENVRAMREWCENTHIMVTPTFFLALNWNSTDRLDSKLYQLPEGYSVSDLKYILLD